MRVRGGGGFLRKGEIAALLLKALTFCACVCMHYAADPLLHSRPSQSSAFLSGGKRKWYICGLRSAAGLVTRAVCWVRFEGGWCCEGDRGGEDEWGPVFAHLLLIWSQAINLNGSLWQHRKKRRRRAWPSYWTRWLRKSRLDSAKATFSCWILISVSESRLCWWVCHDIWLNYNRGRQNAECSVTYCNFLSAALKRNVTYECTVL